MKTTPSHLVAGLLLSAFLTLSPSSTRADTPSATPPASVPELLEQGIYNQDTKGDIDTAISIYKQLIVQARASDALAAQAELRLGECYLKKGLNEEAAATLQKLIKDFPNETDLVAKAQALIPSGPQLNPVPWVDGERLLFKFFLPSGDEIGMVEYRSDLVQSGTQSLWRVGAREDVGQMNSVSSVDADADTFRPISSRWKTSILGDVAAVYHPGEVDISRQGQSGPTPVKPSGPVIDNEEAMDYIRRLPLAVGYKTTIPIFSTLGGSTIPLGFEVQATESVTVPAGTFNCYRVFMDIVGQSFWYSVDSNRYLVQFQVGTIKAKLCSISQRKAGEPVQFHDDELGISLTAPPQWVVCRYKAGQPKGQSLIRTYDADADTNDGGLRMFTTSSLSDDEQKSSRAWAESNFKKEISTLGDHVTIRPDSWKDYTVSGRPGVAFIADYTQNGKPKTLFSLYVLGQKDSERFGFISPADKFDALMTQFDTIVASYQRQ